ncbi:DUF6932 family protein [Flavobacterium foetidum]|uniref:DUF6932 family protein n=1 Tax=Flavobacterium foetidum TaxID=2026681 RepID=UPI00107547B5|nr:hypothetical protein [Flavobacterium foetidum]KAF2514633.1 hypothetical protein E0W73_11815 [Flavobacterium foetidum]
MLTFNNSGLLVPDYKIASTILEFENEFVKKIPSIRRKEIFEAYVKYNDDFKKVCNLDVLHQWINGSFVSKKINPGDIDLVTFLDYSIVLELGSRLDDFIFPHSEEIYGVDAYIIEVYPENHANNFRYISDKAYWLDRFTKTRRIRGNRLSKGFLEIKF